MRINNLIITCIAVVYFVQCETRSVEMKRYTIDLSMPPKVRWNHVLDDYNSSVPLVINYFQAEVYKHRCCSVKSQWH